MRLSKSFYISKLIKYFPVLKIFHPSLLGPGIRTSALHYIAVCSFLSYLPICSFFMLHLYYILFHLKPIPFVPIHSLYMDLYTFPENRDLALMVLKRSLPITLANSWRPQSILSNHGNTIMLPVWSPWQQDSKENNIMATGPEQRLLKEIVSQSRCHLAF